MKTIDFDIWKRKEDDPRYVERVGQRSAAEVFKELEQRLDSLGLLPDEYFLLDREWENDKLIPEDAEFFVTTDYGESEGVYLDGYLKWYADDKPVTRNFFTGKTLGDTGADLDRMFLISSAITKAFHGYGGQYARYMKLGPQEPGGDMVLNLTPEEQRTFIDALMSQREQALGDVDRTEKLLRRMTGSITAYMNTVGERPLHLSDHDKASLAIRDGELQALKELLPKCTDTLDTLLVEAAGRAGDTGRKRMVEVVAAAGSFSEDAYMAASKNAAEVRDIERIKFLMEQAEAHVERLRASYYGEVIGAVQRQDHRAAGKLIRWSRNEWIAAAPPELLINAIRGRMTYVAGDLIDKGIDTTTESADILRAVYLNDGKYMAKYLIESGMKVAPGNHYALDLCVENDDPATGKLLLDSGHDFDDYLAWRANRTPGHTHQETLDELRAHWQSIHPQEQEASAEEESEQAAPQIGGMSL